MRIVMITATPQSVREGSGTYVASAVLPRALRALGHDVTVRAPSQPPGPLGYTYHRFRFNRSITAASLAGADAVVGWDMDGYRLAGRLDRPFTTYVHGQLAEEARFERGMVAATMRVQARAERHSAQHADRVLTVSQFSRRRIAESYDVPVDRIGVVPPAFDTAKWQDALARAQIRVPHERPTVLAVSRMYRRKDLPSLIKAAAVLRQQVPDLLVEIVGDGPERGRLERLVESLGLRSSVSLRGQVGFTALADAYAGADVFCLPSRQEGFGLVFLEAMAAGKPIVACRDTAAEELVEDGVNGRLVPQHDDAALAETLRDLLGDASARTAMGEAGRRRLGAYDASVVAQQFLSSIAT